MLQTCLYQCSDKMSNLAERATHVTSCDVVLAGLPNRDHSARTSHTFFQWLTVQRNLPDKRLTDYCAWTKSTLTKFTLLALPTFQYQYCLTNFNIAYIRSFYCQNEQLLCLVGILNNVNFIKQLISAMHNSWPSILYMFRLDSECGLVIQQI